MSFSIHAVQSEEWIPYLKELNIGGWLKFNGDVYSKQQCRSDKYNY
jgi:hypothetical protein